MNKTRLLYDQDNEYRKLLEFSITKSPLPKVSVGQIWRYYVGVNIGQEISKQNPFMRPCIVLGSIPSSSLLLTVPLSTKYNKHWSRYLIHVDNYKKYGLNKSRVLLSQVKIIDKKRLLNTVSKTKCSSSFIKYIVKNYIAIIKKLPNS